MCEFSNKNNDNKDIPNYYICVSKFTLWNTSKIRAADILKQVKTSKYVWNILTSEYNLKILFLFRKRVNVIYYLHLNSMQTKRLFSI